MRWVLRLLSFALIGAAGWVLWKELGTLSWRDVAAAARAWGPAPLLLAIAMCAASFAILTLTEWAAARSLALRVPRLELTLTSICANALAHSIGFAVLVAGAVRLRRYAAWGASPAAVAAQSVYAAVSYTLGLAALAGMGLLAHPDLHAPGLTLAPAAMRLAGGLLLLAGPAYVGLCVLSRRGFQLGKRRLALPSPGHAALQLFLGVANNVALALIIWALLPQTAVSAALIATAFAAAVAVALLSGAPGGVGVFEGAMLALLPEAPAGQLAAALLGYRVIYFLLPLLIALPLLALRGPPPGRHAAPQHEAGHRGSF